jgi:hypothetical protein
MTHNMARWRVFCVQAPGLKPRVPVGTAGGQ